MDTLPLALIPPAWLGFNYYFIICVKINTSPAYFDDASCSREQSRSGAIISCVASVMHDMVTRRYGNTGPGEAGRGGTLAWAPLWLLQHSN